jgi:hypothetical protein
MVNSSLARRASFEVAHFPEPRSGYNFKKRQRERKAFSRWRFGLVFPVAPDNFFQKTPTHLPLLKFRQQCHLLRRIDNGDGPFDSGRAILARMVDS